MEFSDIEFQNIFANDKIIVILYNNIYDLTNFNHTGGNFLKKYNGTDVSKIFKSVNHGDKHLKILQPYLIGKYIGKN